jgi:hypothetical protein
MGGRKGLIWDCMTSLGRRDWWMGVVLESLESGGTYLFEWLVKAELELPRENVFDGQEVRLVEAEVEAGTEFLVGVAGGKGRLGVRWSVAGRGLFCLARSCSGRCAW